MSNAVAIGDGWTVARRNLFKMMRNPEMVVWNTVSPIMFIVLFVYVFGSNIRTTIPYAEYAMAGIFAQTVIFGSGNTGVGLADDMQKGIIDRFRSLPMARSAVLVGRTTSDLVSNLLVMLMMVVVGLLVGWRPHEGLLSVLAGILLLLAFSYTFCWMSAAIGLSVGSVEAANSVGFIWMFPLTFISNIFIDISKLPTVFRVIAEWNPLSAVVAAARDFFGNEVPLQSSAWPMQNPLLASVLWMALLLAVFIPLSVRQYRRAASH